jgi:hypothetical protein
MMLKNPGNESSEADASDFYAAAERAAAMVEEFDTMGLAQAPAIGGALTQLITLLLIAAPDAHHVFGFLSSCMTNAAAHADEALHPDNSELIH